MTSLCVSSLSFSALLGPHDLISLRTCDTDHLPVYLGLGGRRWYTPFKKRDITGCFPTEKPSTGRCVADIAERYELSIQNSFPSENC